MSRGSPSVDRAIQILDFLTTHPGRGFTLAEISRRLGISRATAHAVVTTLTGRTLLLRDPASGEYRLGPALIPMGSVARRSFPAFAHSLHEAERLAEEFDAQCVVMVATGAELLIVGHAGLAGPLSLQPIEGQRHTLSPPVGFTVLAWAEEDVVEDWLQRLGSEFTDEERQHFRAAIAAIRRRGYAVGLRVARLVDLFDIYARVDLHTLEGRREINAAMAALARDAGFVPALDDLPQEAEISAVSAPVFGPDGTFLCALALVPEGRTVSDLPMVAGAVLRATGRVMSAIDGRRPGQPSSWQPVPVDRESDATGEWSSA